jgi:hypothetical protein
MLGQRGGVPPMIAVVRELEVIHRLLGAVTRSHRLAWTHRSRGDRAVAVLGTALAGATLWLLLLVVP